MNDADIMCAICLTEITDGLFMLSCKHAFHTKCLRRWYIKCHENRSQLFANGINRRVSEDSLTPLVSSQSDDPFCRSFGANKPIWSVAYCSFFGVWTLFCVFRTCQAHKQRGGGCNLTQVKSIKHRLGQGEMVRGRQEMHGDVKNWRCTQKLLHVVTKNIKLSEPLRPHSQLYRVYR